MIEGDAEATGNEGHEKGDGDACVWHSVLQTAQALAVDEQQEGHHSQGSERRECGHDNTETKHKDRNQAWNAEHFQVQVQACSPVFAVDEKAGNDLTRFENDLPQVHVSLQCQRENVGQVSPWATPTDQHSQDLNLLQLEDGGQAKGSQRHDAELGHHSNGNPLWLEDVVLDLGHFHRAPKRHHRDEEDDDGEAIDGFVHSG